VTAPLLIQEVTDLRATRTDYLLSIKLLKEPAAPVEEWSLHPRSGSKVEWVVPMCESLPMQQLELEGVEGDSDEPARRQYVLLRAPAQEALESDSHVTMLYRSMAAGAAFSGQEPTDGDSSPAHRTDSEVCQTQYVFSGRVVYSFEERCLGAPKFFASGGASQRACSSRRTKKWDPPCPSMRTGPKGEWRALATTIEPEVVARPTITATAAHTNCTVTIAATLRYFNAVRPCGPCCVGLGCTQ
jgi:hypothetical protein